MKANELMPGDLVTFKDCQYDEGVVVIKIWEINQEGNAFVFIGDSEVLDEVTIDEEFVGIPITPEILKKNGFVHGYVDSDFYDYEKWEKKVDDKTIIVIKDHDVWFCRVDDDDDLTRSIGIAPVVHTMQHIIRIGGIEKTIEL